MTRCIAGLLFASVGFGQTGAEATLSGRITDAATHQPIEAAQIGYRGGPAGKAVSATSDANGTYSMRLPASQRVGLAISKAGYSTLDIASSDNTSVRLDPGDSATRDFELSRPGSLSGRLVDRDSGRPLAGFYIHAIRWYAGLENSTGFRYPAPATADDGSFSIPNLPAASYAVAIDPPMAGKIKIPEKESAAKKEESGYGSAWYPDVPKPEMATPIVLGYAENRQLEIRMRKHELLHIAGMFEVPEGMETGGISVTLTTEEKGRPTGAEGEIARPGPFRIEGLEEGSYRILAATRSKDGKTRVFANRLVVLTGHSVDDLRMDLRPGVTLRVAVKMAEEKAEPPQRFNFVPLSTDGWGPMDDGGPGNDSSRDRAGLPPGKYRVAVMRMPGYAVSSITLNGTPLPPGAAIDLESPESVLTYILTTQLGGVAGTVRDAGGHVVPGAAVLVAQESAADTGDDPLSLPPGAGETMTADGGGRFLFSGLAAGRYRVVALEGGDRPRAMDAAVIRSRMKAAEVVVVSAGQNATIDVEVGK